MIEGQRIEASPTAAPVVPIHIVDDEPGVRMALVHALEGKGHLVWSYSSGPDFLAALDRIEPGCLLVDICMPGMDGLAVMTELRSRGCDWPLIAMTAHGDVPTAVAAMKLGAIEFIEKPLRPDLIDAAIARGLARLAVTLDKRRERDAARARFARLTPKESAVLHELIAGQLNKGVAYNLGLSVRTVEMHRANLLAKLGVRSVQEAAAAWARCVDDPVESTDRHAAPFAR